MIARRLVVSEPDDDDRREDLGKALSIMADHDESRRDQHLDESVQVQEARLASGADAREDYVYALYNRGNRAGGRRRAADHAAALRLLRTMQHEGELDPQLAEIFEELS